MTETSRSLRRSESTQWVLTSRQSAKLPNTQAIDPPRPVADFRDALKLTLNAQVIHGIPAVQTGAILRGLDSVLWHQQVLSARLGSARPGTGRVDQTAHAHVLLEKEEGNFVERANLLNRPLRTRTVGGVGAGS